MNLIGKNKNILEISQSLKLDFWETFKKVEEFRKVGLIKAIYN